MLAIPGSFVITMVYLPLYMLIAPLLGFSLEYQHIVPRLFTSPIFWFTIILIPTFCLIRDFTWKS